jgi:hypothetical protein
VVMLVNVLQMLVSRTSEYATGCPSERRYQS